MLQKASWQGYPQGDWEETQLRKVAMTTGVELGPAVSWLTDTLQERPGVPALRCGHQDTFTLLCS